jgi:DNA-binding beta-propeller fold protein YncE
LGKAVSGLRSSNGNHKEVKMKKRILLAGLLAAIASSLTAGATDSVCKYIYGKTWGSFGTADGQFRTAMCIAIDSADNIYVADQGNNRIQKFGKDGDFRRAWGSTGKKDGQFDRPCGIAVGVDSVFVADQENKRIQKFSRDGQFLRKWNLETYGKPYFVVVDDANNVFVSCSIGKNGAEILKFNGEGKYIRRWGGPGKKDDQFASYVLSIAVGKENNIFAADAGGGFIKKFSNSGTFIRKWEAKRLALTTDSDGHLFSYEEGAIYISSPTGDAITSFMTLKPTSGLVYSIAVSKNREAVYFLDCIAQQVYKYVCQH